MKIDMSDWTHKWFGWWAEDANRIADAPSLHRVRDAAWDEKERKSVIRYLRSGPVVVASPGIEFSVVDPNVKVGTQSIRTDGEWVWADSLAYYLETFRVGLPPHFLMHIRSLHYEVPSVDVEQVFPRLEIPGC